MTLFSRPLEQVHLETSQPYWNPLTFQNSIYIHIYIHTYIYTHTHTNMYKNTYLQKFPLGIPDQDSRLKTKSNKIKKKKTLKYACHLLNAEEGIFLLLLHSKKYTKIRPREFQQISSPWWQTCS